MDIRAQLEKIIHGAQVGLPEPSQDMINRIAEKMRIDVEAVGGMTDPVSLIVYHAARMRADVAEQERVAQIRANSGQVEPCRFRRAQKGVCLIGGIGPGKTIALKVMAALSATSPVYIAVPELALGFATDGAEYIKDKINMNRGRHMILDDIGAEQTTKSFGTVLPIEEIIMSRYLLWQESRILTHFATNLGGEDLEERYKKRVFDRMNEMCEKISVDGGSLRGKE